MREAHAEIGKARRDLEGRSLEAHLRSRWYLLPPLYNNASAKLCLGQWKLSFPERGKLSSPGSDTNSGKTG